MFLFTWKTALILTSVLKKSKMIWLNAKMYIESSGYSCRRVFISGVINITSPYLSLASIAMLSGSHGKSLGNCCSVRFFLISRLSNSPFLFFKILWSQEIERQPIALIPWDHSKGSLTAKVWNSRWFSVKSTKNKISGTLFCPLLPENRHYSLLIRLSHPEMTAFCLLLCKMFLLFQGSDLMYYFSSPVYTGCFHQPFPCKMLQSCLLICRFFPSGELHLKNWSPCSAETRISGIGKII